MRILQAYNAEPYSKYDETCHGIFEQIVRECPRGHGHDDEKYEPESDL